MQKPREHGHEHEYRYNTVTRAISMAGMILIWHRYDMSTAL